VEIETASSELRLLNERVGELRNRLKELKSDLARKAKLEKEEQRLQDRESDLGELKSLFKSQGFVNFVSRVYLRAICHAANIRFAQLTRQKLHLELAEDNSFEVRDYLNDGKIRSVKTLSGGQMFQASLSLAIALGDQIQTLANARQHFFFLDEGFGSLDAESLRTVFDTLSSLRRENRVVGIISHVEALQQEIAMHLRVENTEEFGSRIVESWR
jgi:exonuclease SbcC